MSSESSWVNPSWPLGCPFFFARNLRDRSWRPLDRWVLPVVPIEHSYGHSFGKDHSWDEATNHSHDSAVNYKDLDGVPWFRPPWGGAHRNGCLQSGTTQLCRPLHPEHACNDTWAKVVLSGVWELQVKGLCGESAMELRNSLWLWALKGVLRG